MSRRRLCVIIIGLGSGGLCLRIRRACAKVVARVIGTTDNGAIRLEPLLHKGFLIMANVTTSRVQNCKQASFLNGISVTAQHSSEATLSMKIIEK